jgi:hypothetical protein
MRRQDAKRCTLQGASPAQRSLSDARWHQHGTTHKERLGPFKAGELETRTVFCKGENGGEAASPVPAGVQETMQRHFGPASQLERSIPHAAKAAHNGAKQVSSDEKTADIYRASWVGHPQDEGIEILDLATGLPVPRDTRANGTQSVVVQQDEVLQDAAAGAAPAQSGKVEVAPHKTEEEYEILDL